MRCIKCGRPLAPQIINGQFTGDYYCDVCKLGINDCVYREPMQVVGVGDKTEQDIRIEELEHELAIYKKALELACNDIQDMYCSDYCSCTRDESCKVKCPYQIYYNKEQFLNQAKKELEEQNGSKA